MKNRQLNKAQKKALAEFIETAKKIDWPVVINWQHPELKKAVKQHLRFKRFMGLK